MDQRTRLVALAVEIENPYRNLEERLDAREVVAHVFDQLGIARRMRAVRLVDQQTAVGSAIEVDLAPPWRRERLVIAEHALPFRARVRRFDQWIGIVAELSLLIGQLKLRRTDADAGRRFLADPAVHVIAPRRGPGPA